MMCFNSLCLNWMADDVLIVAMHLLNWWIEQSVAIVIAPFAVRVDEANPFHVFHIIMQFCSLFVFHCMILLLECPLFDLFKIHFTIQSNTHVGKDTLLCFDLLLIISGAMAFVI
eukprot:1115258_1